MSEYITKEIRDWALNTACITNGAHFELDRILDGIDSYFWNAMQDKQSEIYKLNFDIGNMQDKLVVSMLLPFDADGVRCKLGDAMYSGLFEFVIVGVGRVDDVDVIFYRDNDNAYHWVNVSLCHHSFVDSQEKLDIDARTPADEYWHCEDVYCDDCPSKIDGKTPKEIYNTDGCYVAKCVEILSRQRKLDSES